MQILHWFFKVTCERSQDTISNPSCKKNTVSDCEAKTTCAIIVGGKFKRLSRSERYKNFKPFALLFRKDIAKACFYSTLNLRRLRNSDKRRYWIHTMKMKKEGVGRSLRISEKADSTIYAGNKILPISDATLSSSKNKYDQCGIADKKKGLKGDKTRPISRMKELLRWAATAKSGKSSKFTGRNILTNKRAIKAASPDDDQFSNESSKISFRWDVESCSTMTSAISASSSLKSDQAGHTVSMNSTPTHDREHVACRKGNWITTDSEFVVLEL